MKSRIGKELSNYTKELNDAISKDGIQIIVISRPTAYGEYAPYKIVNSKEELKRLVLEMQKTEAKKAL